MEQLNSDLSAKLRGATFFVTGGTCMKVGLSLNYLPAKGVNLSSDGQTLQESYSTAARVFEHAAPKTIKFVIIGLPLNSDDEAAKFLTDAEVKEMLPILENYCKLCIDNGARPVVVTVPVERTVQKTFNGDILTCLSNAISALAKNYKVAFVDLLDVKLAKDCFQNKWLLNFAGAAATSTLLAEELYRKGLISAEELLSLDKIYSAVPSKALQEDYRTLMTRVFCKAAREDFKRLSQTMSAGKCKDLMARVFFDLTYEHLFALSKVLPKKSYNDVATRVFKISAQALRRKDKIKVGFVLYDSSMWCGDDLYNLFALDERFEPTIFLCVRDGSSKNERLQKDFLQGIKLFESHGLNFVAPEKLSAPVPAQDVLIFLTPYFWRVLSDFSPLKLTPKTLMTYIPYSFGISVRAKAHYNTQIFHVAWKIFISSLIDMQITEKYCTVGVPRGLYSGYPRLDIFFEKETHFHFEWKMARPDAKKIIWAPHHSVTEDSVRCSTFRWNYQFMYEFAKAHPEISWIVKPHPNLSYRAVRGGIFPSIKAFEEYMQKWNDLPNAQVYTGAYYQAIFATSDGMIHDSVSFVAEYQCVDKPMIYLTRETQNYNELGKEILSVSYCVDGKDLDGIAAMIQRVFIEGDDYKAAVRKEVFDKYLNYPKTNGMLASEFIYKSIADEVTAPVAVD